MNKQQTKILLTKILPRFLIIGIIAIAAIVLIGIKIWDSTIDHEKGNALISNVGAKLNYLDKLNEGVPPTISFSGYYDTLFLTLSLESEAKETQTPYNVIKRQFKNGGTLNCTKVYYNWYSTESPIFLENARNKGYKNFQAKVLYKDGTIEDSEIIELD
ncbi:hypothetical protein [Bizionia arctica]|nr:hypothetical protein [Bizionia arctica]